MSLIKNVKVVSDHYLLWNIDHRAFKFHMLIGLGKGMTTFDFELTRSKVKVTMVLFVKGGYRSFSWELFTTELSYFIGLGKDMTPIGSGFTRVKVKVTKVNC